MVFNATFNNISVILWPSVVLVEKKENIELNFFFFEIDVNLTSMSNPFLFFHSFLITCTTNITYIFSRQDY
jgi:hypothetical protein